jgi:exopolysaccharide biosynthesis WecB/TagA/CpsF family protein
MAQTVLSARLGGCPVDLLEQEEALDRIARGITAFDGPPLGVASINLDHLHHFGLGSALAAPGDADDGIDWLNLIDGAPVAAKAEQMTGRAWPRLAGSDLAGPVLDLIEQHGASVGFIGGAPETHALLSAKLEAERPGLRVSGYWAPSREDLADPEASRAIAAEIAAAGTTVLVVCLGKPRQEEWISAYGTLCGARVMLAFGAVVDFLAGRISRAPAFVSEHGLEWAWRLAKEPKRLFRRYVVQGPPALQALRRNSLVVAPPVTAEVVVAGRPQLRFTREPGPVDVAVVVVAYNSEGDIDPLIESVRRGAGGLRVRVVVVDNDSRDATLERAMAHDDVVVVRAGGNLGYSGGLNVALAHVGEARSVLVLNPDLVVDPDAIQTLYRRMTETGAAVVVPHLRDEDGADYPSLRREPTVLRALGDALFGSRWASRSAGLSEMVTDQLHYRYAHPIDWATGAALLIDRSVVDAVGDWDERYFLYSEETDFFHRVREAGGSVWYEPSASMLHRRGGSGTSDELVALMAVNRIRYMEKHASPARARLFRAVVVLHETLRYSIPSHRLAQRFVSRRRSWASLPKAELSGPRFGYAGSPVASIVIPAHNEEAVIARALDPLAPFAASGVLEVIVACNGCTDDTARIAASFPSVQVLVIPAASKVAALNAADRVATAWPRAYLDADIELPPDAVFRLIDSLRRGPALAGRPVFRYETAAASSLVRAYYRARSRMPSLSSALWGAGVYALTREGHDRLGSFPEVTADDLHVDRLFSGDDKAIVEAQAALVRVPLRSSELLGVLRRAQRGSREQGVDSGGRTRSELVASIRGPRSAVDAVVYAGFAAVARRDARRTATVTVWERDDSSRIGVVGRLS